MQRVKLSLACLLCLSLVGVASAQTELESTAGVATFQEYSGSATFAGTYFDIRSMSGDGVGYRNGYTQIGTFVPIWLDDDRYIAPSNRLTITDLGDVGYNGGAVYRRYRPDTNRIFGANFYYDFDQSAEGFEYHQVGFGAETLGEIWDARFNVYLPTTDDVNFVRPLALDCMNPLLQGNAIGFLATGLYQESIEGVDFEIGAPLTKRTPWLRGYAGAYFYDARRDNPIGVRARMEALISNDLIVGVNVTNDSNFGTNVNAVVDFRFSGWLPTRYFPNYSVRERMLAPVQRNWRIATANTAVDEFAPAKNPDTGNPYFIVWVDNSNAGPGTGTYENPLSDLPANAPGADIVVVRTGNTTLLNPLRGSIVLENNQRLLGEGKAHEIDLLPMYNGLMCPVASYTLPGIATDGNFPYLTSIGNNDIVTLRNNNEVSAFNMVRAGGAAITNFPAVGSRNFDLNCLNLLNNDGGGILLTNASGVGRIHMVNAINNTAGGISIDSAPAGLNLTITDTNSSSIAATPGFPQAFGLQLLASPGPITASITNSDFNRNTTGIILSGTGDFNVSMTEVRADNNLTDGLQINTVGSDVDLELRSSSFSRNGGFGIAGIMTGGSLDLLARNVIVNNNDSDNLNLDLTNTRMAIDIENATFLNSTLGSGVVISNSGGNGTGTVRMNNVVATGNRLDGFRFSGDNFADITATVTASIFSNNGQDAFSVSATNSAEVGLNVGAVVATGSGRHGLNFNATTLGDLNINFLASNLNFSGTDAALVGRGVNGFADNAFVSLTMLSTTASNAGADGMFVTALNNAQVGISVNNGSFADSAQNNPGSDGVHIVTDTGADVVLQINNTPINNSFLFPFGTQDDGLVFEAANNSTILANVSNSDLSNNLSNAIDATVFSGASVTLNLLNSNGLNSGEDGIRFDVQTGGQLTINMQSSNFDFSGQSGLGNGILGFVRTGGQVTINSLNSSVTNSAENGFELDIANIGSSFTGNWESGNFSNSGRAMLGVDQQDAFHITASDQALVDISLFTTPSANTGGLMGTQQRGLWANVSGGADLIFEDLQGDLSGNLLNAINLTVTNPGSTAQLTITDTAANNSGEDGFIFDLSDSAIMVANFLRSTLDSSGLAGMAGDEFDAIDGTLDTNSIGVITFQDTPVTNAFADGMRINAFNDSLFIATFDNSPLDGNGTNNSGNGMRLNFESGADGSIVLQNGSTVIGNGDDGIFISAQNAGTTVSVTTLNSIIANNGNTATANGGNGIAAFVFDDAAVQLNINDTPIGNTMPTLPQLRGLLFDVQSGGLLVGNFTNSPIVGHDLEGIAGSVDGAGTNDSAAILTLIDSPVDNNGTFGAIFNVTNGGDLVLDASGPDSSFSNNGATGIFANIDGAGSTFELVLDETTVDMNGFGLGGDGIALIGDNGAFITGDITNASISNNANAGVVIVLQNGSVSNLAQSIVNTAIDGNGDEGILALIDTGSTLLLNVIGGSISDNGSNGNFDNVNIFASDAGTMVETHFQGTVADNSTRSGFNFTTLNGAMNLTQLRAGVSASNNEFGNGVRFVADGAGTQAVLFMSDTSANGFLTALNNFSDNGTSVLTAHGGPDADEPLTGGGVFFQATNVDVAAIRFSGTADNNGNASDPIANRDIDGDGDGDHDGLFVYVDGANQFSFEVASGSASGNVDQGIDLNVSNVTDFDAVTKTSVITPPDVTVGAGGGISIIDVIVDGNVNGPGISLVIDGPITLNGDIVIDRVSSTNNAGDGLLLQLTDVAGTPNLTVTNSQFADNGGHGFNLDLTNSDLGDVLFMNNRVGQSSAVGLFFVITGNTFGQPFNITNNSQAGVDITRFRLDILPSGNIWDTDPADLGAPIPFTPQGGTDLLTGLNTVNGNPWPNALITGGVPGSQGLTDLTFNDFNATETFTWLIDADPIGIPGGAVFGSDLIGSNIIVDFSNGATLSGGLFAVMGDPTASQFLVTGGSIGSAGLSGNALDGLHIEQVNSNIASFTADDSAFNDNGLSGTGSGINFAVMTGSDIGPVVVSGSDLSGNATDGFRLVNVAPTSNLFDLTFDANQSISGNGGRGINLTMPNGVNVNLALTNNAGISANTLEGVLVDMGENATLNMLNVFGNTFGNTGNGNGGPGLRVDANLGSTVNLNLGDSTQAANTFTGNGSAGAAITLNSTAVGNVTVENTTIAGTTGGGAFGGDGLAIRLTGNAQMPNLVIGDAGAANTSFSGNAGDGIGIQLNGFSQLTNPTVQNIRSTGNTGDGLNVLRQGSGVIDNFLITDSTFTGNQDGIHLQSEFALLTDEYTLTNNTFNNNTLRGAFINAQADARISLAVTNNTFDNNGSDGMQIVTVAVSPGDAAEVFSSAAWDLNSFSNNGTTAGAGGAGLELSGNGVFNLVIGVLNPNPLVFSNVFNDNAGDGIEINGPGSLTLIDAQVAGNNTAGSANGLAGIDINSVGGNAITVVLSDITGNLGDGVEIDNVAGSGSTFTFFDTFITFNGRDGIEYVDQGSGTLTVTGTSPLNSVIADNGTSGTGGRGIDIVAGGSTITNSTVIINNTGILRNRQEGVNVILTADAAQGNAANRDALSSAALANNGAITSTPFLNFTMTNSIVNNNGQVAGNIGGSGLVMRVGTTRGGDGIASNGAAGGFASAANGGVNATVTGNTLMGNFGADVVFESFVSIANSGNVPAAGNWTDQNENPRNFANDVFDPTGYQSDPIARLDLMFSNNTGEELDVTRIGAFYNDNDPNWKSRGITGVSNDTPADGGADDNGVFSSGARHRNAQRLAARNVDFLFNAGQKIDPQLTIGASDNFLFAGLGQSSFRVNNQTTANNNFGLGIGFLIDNFAGDPFGNPAIYDSILEANGVFNPVGPNTSIFDRMPYGWSLLP